MMRPLVFAIILGAFAFVALAEGRKEQATTMLVGFAVIVALMPDKRG